MSMFAFYATLTFFIVLCVFFALLILVQKGRGGGISAAFGGAGGNTAFGSKTGDVLTWATSIVFGIFLVLCVTLNLLANKIDTVYRNGEAAIIVPGSTQTDLPAIVPEGSLPPVQPTTTPSSQPAAATPIAPSIVPPQDINPRGLAEPAVTQPATNPA